MMLTTYVVLTLMLTTMAAPASTSRTSDDDIRVMSFNVRNGGAPDGPNHWTKRRELFFHTIDAFDPDLLGTQELLAEQADEMREHFKGYGFVGLGREDGKRAGEYCGMFYRSGCFELIDSGHFWLSEHPDVPGSVSWDSALTRMASWVKLRDRRDPRKRAFLWINTHWDHVGEVARLESGKLIRAQLARLNDNGATPAIVTGDFNCFDTSDAYRAILGGRDDRPQLIDTYRATHPRRRDDEATFHGFSGKVEGSRIDFILHTPAFETVGASIDRAKSDDGRCPSDHFPVTARLRFAW